MFFARLLVLSFLSRSSTENKLKQQFAKLASHLTCDQITPYREMLNPKLSFPGIYIEETFT
jgi:hypothetical protein